MAEKILNWIEALVEGAEEDADTVIIPDFDDDILSELTFG